MEWEGWRPGAIWSALEMTAGPLQPGSLRTPVCIFVNRPPPEEVPRIEGVRLVFHRCWFDEATTRGAGYYHEGKDDQ